MWVCLHADADDVINMKGYCWEIAFKMFKIKTHPYVAPFTLFSVPYLGHLMVCKHDKNKSTTGYPFLSWD